MTRDELIAELHVLPTECEHYRIARKRLAPLTEADIQSAAHAEGWSPIDIKTFNSPDVAFERKPQR